jgi:hypothetical protein
MEECERGERRDDGPRGLFPVAPWKTEAENDKRMDLEREPDNWETTGCEGEIFLPN